MITIQFSSGDVRTFPLWFRPAVIAAYCERYGFTAEIIDVRG